MKIYLLQSLKISFSTTLRYFCLFFSETNGTDQNCFVLLQFPPHPKTNVKTPNTSLSFTEFKYIVLTGNAGAPWVR